MAAPIILCDTAGMDRKTWLAVRAHGPDGSIPIALGGSDISAVFGLSPWKTPLDLWMEKAGRIVPDDSENAWQKEMGHRMEPIVAELYALKTGNQVFTDTYLYQHADYPWALANIDYGMVDQATRKKGGLECKFVTYHKADEWKGGRVPMHYEYQCRYYIAIKDVDFWDLACMWGNGENDFAVRRIHRDLDTEAMILGSGSDFVESVRRNNPPAMGDVAPELAMKSLSRIYGATITTATIEFGRKHERQIRRIAALQQENRELERQVRRNDKEVTALSVQIAETMKEHEHGMLETPLERFCIDYVSSNQRRVNGDKLKRLYPNIYEEVLNPPGQRRIKIAAMGK